MAGEHLIPLLALQFQVYIWMDGGREEQKIGEKATIIIKNSYTNFLFISLSSMHSEKYNTATVGVLQKKGGWLVSI